MKMKKIAALLLAAALLLCLTGCGEKTPSGKENAGTAATTAASATDGEFENKIALSLDKTDYAQAERIEVTMDFAEVDQDNAVIVIVGSDLPHGQPAPPEEDTQEYRWIADFSEIPFYLWAPEQDGRFEVRVYAASDREELAAVSFTVGETAPPDSGSGSGGNASVGNASGVLTEGGDCTQQQMEDTIVAYLSQISQISSLTLSGGSRIEYTKAGDALNDFDLWTVYDPELDNDAMYDTMNSQLTAAGFSYEEDMIGRHVWYVEVGGEHMGILLWPDDEVSPDGYYILMMTHEPEKY